MIIEDGDVNNTYKVKYKKDRSRIWITKCSGKEKNCILGEFLVKEITNFTVNVFSYNEEGDYSTCHSRFTVSFSKPLEDKIDTKDLESNVINAAKSGDYNEFNKLSSIFVTLLSDNKVRIDLLLSS